MKRLVLASFVLLSMAALGMALSDDQAAKAGKTGEVVSIDASQNLIVIKDASGAETRILVDSTTKITREGKTLALADIKAGDKVMTDCEDSADGCKAKSVQVVVQKPAN
jgi:hypothetical protein